MLSTFRSAVGRLSRRARVLISVAVVVAVVGAGTLAHVTVVASAEREAATESLASAHAAVDAAASEARTADVELLQTRTAAETRLGELADLASTAGGYVSPDALAELVVAIAGVQAALDLEPAPPLNRVTFTEEPTETDAMLRLSASVTAEARRVAARTAIVLAQARAIAAALDAADARIPALVDSAVTMASAVLDATGKATAETRAAVTAAVETATTDPSADTFTALAGAVQAVKASHDAVTAAEALASRTTYRDSTGRVVAPPRKAGTTAPPVSGRPGTPAPAPIDRTRRITHTSFHTPDCNGARMIRMYSATTSSGGGFRMDSVTYPYHVDAFDTPTGWGINVYQCEL